MLVRFETYGAAVNQTAVTFNNTVNAIIPNADGSVDFGGAFTTVTPVGGSSTSRSRLTRILANGTVESNATIPGANAAVTMMHRDGSNRLVLAGTTITNITYNPTPSHARVNFARLSNAGAIDATYTGPFTSSNNIVYAMTSESDGRVYIGGQFGSSLPTAGQYLARLDATTGVVDTSFATASGLTTVRALHLRSDGKLLVGHNGGVWLLNSNGTRDLTFTGSTTGALAFLPLANGDVIVATASTLYKLNSAGGTVAGWPAGTINYGNSSNILLQPLANGDICITGTFNTFNSATAGHLAFVNADGTVDNTYATGSGFNNSVNAIALDAQGRLHLGGLFTTYKGATVGRYVILNSATTTPADPGAPAMGSPLENFLANAGVPANKRGAQDDPDNDGIPNLIEFGLGLEPNTSDASAMPDGVKDGPNLTITYRRAQPGLTYLVETSPTLTGGTWTSVGVDQGTPDGNGITTASIPLGPSAGFLRISVTLNP